MNTEVRQVLEFAQRLLAVLDEGRKTATYKYAVLLALMDLCLVTRDESGAALSMVTTEQLAERVVELYWPHAQRFSSEEEGGYEVGFAPTAGDVPGISTDPPGSPP